MANIFRVFDTTPANIVADVKAAILQSTDWSNPSGQRVHCTTTNGADMIVDLAQSAATAVQMTLGVYLNSALATHDRILMGLWWRQSGGATTDSVRVQVAAGKDHLVITTEGPRATEVNAVDAVNGSPRTYFILSAIVPAFGSDTVPAVMAAGSAPGSISTPIEYVYVSRNQTNEASWVPAHTATIHHPAHMSANLVFTYPLAGVQRMARGDGKTYTFPWYIFEIEDGLRGTLKNIFWAGFQNRGYGATTDIPTNPYAKITYGSDTYIQIPIQRGVSAASPATLPMVTYPSYGVVEGPIIAVPFG